MKRLLLAILTALLLSSLAHAAPPPQWLPQDSWPGGKQYDARLEKTVTFWGTGVPAADLFASITKQTGVPLGFSPPDDDNGRICLNVYLNPKQPPTLRDLLVQIGWVMDCAWAVEGRGEQSRYLLLRTSIGTGALERRRQQMREADWRAQQEEEEIQRQLHVRALGRLEELAGDLGLSRGDAIRKYRGTDDQKLVVLLDPVRTAFARFLLASPEVLARFPDSGADLEWAQLTEEQRRWVRESVTAWSAQMATELPEAVPEIPWDDPAAVAALHLTVQVNPAGEGGGFCCWVGFGDGADPRRGEGRHVMIGGLIQLTFDPRLVGVTTGSIEMEVRRLLGEEVQPEGASEADRRREEEQRREQLRKRAEPELARSGPTSPQNVSLLSSLRLPAEPGEPYALWQLQEWAAAATGLHLISDHFYQPAESRQRYVSLLEPSASGTSALTALRFAALPWRTLEESGWTWYPDGGDTWEWGDAGSFLRFRSRNRDLWREALLPKAAEEALDRWLAPYLPGEPEPAATLPEVGVPLDLLRQGQWLEGLTREQRRWGKRVASGDPTDAAETYRRVFREGIPDTGERIPYQFLTQLDEEQMSLLQGEGLVVGRDIPMAAVQPYCPSFAHSDPLEEGSTLRLITTEARDADDTDPAPCEYRATTWSELRLLWPQGGYADLGSIPRNLLLHPTRLPHLVPPPEGAMVAEGSAR